MDIFQLPVLYKGEEVEFESRFLPSTYMPRFEVNVNGTPLTFERDDEGNFRAINYSEQTGNSIDVELLAAIIDSLDAVTK